MNAIHTIYDDTKKRRVIVFQRDNGSFGFEEQRFSNEPLEMAWIPFGRYSLSLCDTSERALAEARGRHHIIPSACRNVIETHETAGDFKEP
jgi:hypothetical protein